MANYGYTSGGSAVTVKSRFQWGSAYGGAAGTKEAQSKSKFLRKTEVRNDDVPRPVIAEANQGNVEENKVGYNKSEGLKREETPPTAPEPTMISSGSWARRSRWAVRPEEPLAKATNDRGTAANYSRESARPQVAASTVPDRPSSQPKPTYYGKNDRSPTRTIDSREAARMYGGESDVIYDENKGGSANKTIDSNEAAKKYRGQFIF